MNEIIREASSEQDYQAFAQLVTEYVAWLRSRYERDTRFIDGVLAKQSLAGELESLATIYGAPGGRAFLAFRGNEVRGCGAYRRLEDGTCEMKRLFVPGRFQGTGLGRRLCDALIGSARDDGFRFMRLDSGNLMMEAITLYRSLGFRECAPYYEYPAELATGLVFMELALAS